MTAITSTSAMTLVASICQLIAIIWMVVICMRVLFGTLDITGFLRGLMMVSIIGQILPAITGAIRPSAVSDGQPIVAAYQQMVDALGGMVPGTAAPGLALVQQSVEISAGIWSGLIMSGLIYLPVIAWMVVVAVDLAHGTPLPTLAIRLLFWWLLWSICAGGVGTTVSRMAYQCATAVAQAALVSVHRETNRPAVARSTTWSVAEVVAASSTAELPTALASITAPVVHSIQRILPPDSPAYQSLVQKGFFSSQALVEEQGMYLVSTFGADPHTGFSQEYPSLDPFLSRTVMPTLYLNSPDIAAWAASACVDAAAEVIDGTGIMVGVVPIGDCPGLSQTVTAAYATVVARETERVSRQVAPLVASQTADHASLVRLGVLQDRLARLAGFHAPTLVMLTTSPIATLVATRYRSYYADVVVQTPDLLTAHRTALTDAWGVMCLMAGADVWPPAAAGAAFPNDPFARLACAPSVRSSMEAPPRNPADQWVAGRGDAVVGRVFAYVVQLLMDDRFSTAYLLLGVVVWLVAPLVVHVGFYLIALGCFVLNLAYPVAAYLALFPHQSMALVEWAKGVFWVVLWIPFIVIGISLATPAGGTDIVPPLVVLMGRVMGGHVGGMVASAASGPGTVTGDYITMMMGIVMILMSWWFATLMLNPGLSGISSAMRWMTQVGATVVSSAAGGSGLVAQAVAHGVRAAGHATGISTQDPVGSPGSPGAAQPTIPPSNISRTGGPRMQRNDPEPHDPTPTSGWDAVSQAMDRLQAVTDPTVAAAGYSAAVDGSITQAMSVIDRAVQGSATAGEDMTRNRRPGVHRAAGLSAPAAPDHAPDTAPESPSPRADDRIGNDTHPGVQRTGSELMMVVPTPAMQASADRWLEQAAQEPTSASSMEASGAAMYAALHSGDWRQRGRAAGLVRRHVAAAAAADTMAGPEDLQSIDEGPASARSQADAVPRRASGAMGPDPASPYDRQGLQSTYSITQSLAVADAMVDHMAETFTTRLGELGIPAYAYTHSAPDEDPAVCRAWSANAEESLAASRQLMRADQVADAMASATQGASQAAQSGDATMIRRADLQVLTVAGAVMTLSTDDPAYEQAIIDADRGLTIMAFHRSVVLGADAVLPIAPVAAVAPAPPPADHDDPSGGTYD